ATQLFCSVHKVAVCGDCLCLPEHSICEVKTYSDWVVGGDGVHEFSPKCSLCTENICISHPVIRLSCLHILHTQCLLDLLQMPPSATGYACSSCGSQIWPPKKHLVNSSSALCKRIEDLLVKSIKLNMTSEALLPLPSESSFNSTNIPNGKMSVAPISPPDMMVPTPMTSLATLNGDQPILKMLKVLSRKSSRNDKKTNDFRIEEETDRGSKYTPKGPHSESVESLFPCSLPNKMILPITAPTPHKETDSHLHDLSNGRWRRYRPTATIDPRKILFIFATL
ncbi:hypothetical protein KI387_003815, partial [Taxus chinensis]